jgi:hypothetical protein
MALIITRAWKIKTFLRAHFMMMMSKGGKEGILRWRLSLFPAFRNRSCRSSNDLLRAGRIALFFYFKHDNTFPLTEFSFSLQNRGGGIT